MASDEKSITVGGTELLTRSKRQGEQYMDVLGDMSDYLGNLVMFKNTRRGTQRLILQVILAQATLRLIIHSLLTR